MQKGSKLTHFQEKITLDMYPDPEHNGYLCPSFWRMHRNSISVGTKLQPLVTPSVTKLQPLVTQCITGGRHLLHIALHYVVLWKQVRFFVLNQNNPLYCVTNGQPFLTLCVTSGQSFVPTDICRKEGIFLSSDFLHPIHSRHKK